MTSKKIAYSTEFRCGGIVLPGGQSSDGCRVGVPPPVPDLPVDSDARLHLQLGTVFGNLEAEVRVRMLECVVLRKQ